MNHTIEFKTLNAQLLASAESHLSQWLPGGKKRGNEFQCGSLQGEAGRSLSVNMSTGQWADFATGDKGGDLISLYAAIKNINQVTAARELSGQDLPKVEKRAVKQRPLKPVPPPSIVDLPSRKSGPLYKYTDEQGQILFLIHRFVEDGKKQFHPFTYWPDGTWKRKQWPAPRPLYRLPEIHKKNAVILVEGEKACVAAEKFAPDVYAVATWAGGAQAWNKTDLTPLYGKSILLWPDADEAGRKCMEDIAKVLLEHCRNIKILQTNDLPDGADAADFPFSSFDLPANEFIKWARERAVKWPEPIVAPEPPMPEEPVGPATTIRIPAEPEKPAELLPIPHNLFAQWDKIGIAKPEKGAPYANLDNSHRIISYYFSDKLWFDQFYNRIFIRDGSVTREWHDEVDTLKLLDFIQGSLGIQKMGKEQVMQAATLYAHQHERNEPQDWLNSLKWDGEPRVIDFFPFYMGAELSEYTQAVSRNFWVSMTARMLSPGCKCDNMVILEGPQGAYKSTALQVIGGKYFTEIHESVTSKDFFLAIRGAMIVEIGELDAFTKAEANTIKRIISSSTDRFREPYARHPRDYPRNCILVGTTNEDSYLKDSTGGRRFWPIAISDIKLDLIQRDREQLFAEAVQLFKQGVKWHEVPVEAREIQESRRESDPWEVFISDYLNPRQATMMNEVRLQDIISDALDTDPDKMSMMQLRRIGKIMRMLGWRKKTARREGQLMKIWIKPETSGADNAH